MENKPEFNNQSFNFSDYFNNQSNQLIIQDIINKLNSPKLHLTAVPTFTPTTFLDQIQFVDTGSNRYLYIYINNTWRYISLT